MKNLPSNSVFRNKVETLGVLGPVSRSHAGLTLIELLMSAAIVVLLATAFITAFTMSLERSSIARAEYASAELLQSQVQQALVLPYQIDANPDDDIDKLLVPEILKTGSDAAGTGKSIPSTFNYGANIRGFTPTFETFDGRTTGTNTNVSFSAVPIYNSASVSRTDLDSGQSTALIEGTLRKKVTLVDNLTGSAAAVAVSGSSSVDDLGIRIVEFELTHDHAMRGGRTLAPSTIVTFRAPDADR